MGASSVASRRSLGFVADLGCQGVEIVFGRFGEFVGGIRADVEDTVDCAENRGGRSYFEFQFLHAENEPQVVQGRGFQRLGCYDPKRIVILERDRQQRVLFCEGDGNPCGDLVVDLFGRQFVAEFEAKEFAQSREDLVRLEKVLFDKDVCQGGVGFGLTCESKFQSFGFEARLGEQDRAEVERF